VFRAKGIRLLVFESRERIATRWAETRLTAKPFIQELGPAGKEKVMDMSNPEKSSIEKFTATDLSSLREELAQSGLDSWQAAELISAFLNTRGYGVSSHEARGAATRMESFGGSLKSMQEELEKLAFVM
jgi:hypothetical protein